MEHPTADIRRIIAEIKGKVLITTHYNPDGDAVGASLALYHLLQSIGIEVHVLIPNDVPSFLKWMPGISEVVIYEKESEKGNHLIQNASVIFCLDFNALHRVKLFHDELRRSSSLRILIDHHLEPEADFDIVYSEIGVSSTSELLFKLLIADVEHQYLSREIAECLYVGIMTDTGSFSYSCNKPGTYLITARLIETGIDAEKIHRLVYDTYSENRMRLLGFCLSERLKVLNGYSTAYIWLTKQDLSHFEYEPGDTEGVVNYALSIDKISLAALFTERNDRIRISLRSKGDFSVNELARKHFSGGGHKNAAGGDSFDSMEVTLEKFELLLKEYRDLLISNHHEYMG